MVFHLQNVQEKFLSEIHFLPSQKFVELESILGNV